MSDLIVEVFLEVVRYGTIATFFIVACVLLWFVIDRLFGDGDAS